MISVLLVGKGNVAKHLHDTFLSIDNIVFKQISSRDLKNIPKWGSKRSKEHQNW